MNTSSRTTGLDLAVSSQYVMPISVHRCGRSEVLAAGPRLARTLVELSDAVDLRLFRTSEGQ